MNLLITAPLSVVGGIIGGAVTGLAAAGIFTLIVATPVGPTVGVFVVASIVTGVFCAVMCAFLRELSLPLKALGLNIVLIGHLLITTVALITGISLGIFGPIALGIHIGLCVASLGLLAVGDGIGIGTGILYAIASSH